MSHNKKIQFRIAEILRNLGRKECLVKAELLENAEKESRSLNLRSLDLTSDEGIQVALILSGNNSSRKPGIESISFSYNRALKDKGTIALIKSLPKSIQELGFVDCGIEESGGQELLEWMKNVPELKMLCAEQNLFSDKLKSEFKKFREMNPKIIVVV